MHRRRASASDGRGIRPTVLNQKTRLQRAILLKRWIADVGKPFQSSDKTIKSRPVITQPAFRGVIEQRKSTIRSAAWPSP